MSKIQKRWLGISFIAAVMFVISTFGFIQFGSKSAIGQQSAGLGADAMSIVQKRGLSPEDVTGALSTYVPTGKYDDHIMFASGGHSGQILAIGLPSMRLLRVIAAFTPEPWQGYGIGVQESPLITPGPEVTAKGSKGITWADTHHPALSETNGNYDGQFLFINDKGNGRFAVIDLRDFETKQIIANPLINNDHGCTVTPNTEYVIEGTQYALPLGIKYAPISDYQKSYRGLVAFWKFNREKGRIEPENSFAIELPPYWQDLSDAGKAVSDGWFFMNSFNTEMATGGIESGNPPFEAGVAERDMDYLHVINWKKAELVVNRDKKFKMMEGMRVIPLDVAIEEGLLHFVPESKSPHGVDVTPSGKHIVVSGKLDPHVTIFDFEKIKKAIEEKDFEGNDPYGVPILRYDAVMKTQVELGLGPLHTQFDNKGYAYTSLFLESAVARWTLGEDKFQAPEKPWTVVGKVPIHYNVGHISVAEGDTMDPSGDYLVSLNKWSVDRFPVLGPLLPQNLQLISIDQTGDRMKILYDMPIGLAEPHYAQIIKADKLKTWEVYPEVGWDALNQTKSEHAVTQGRIERDGNHVKIYMTAIRSHFDPEHVVVNKGDHLTFYITNLERTKDATHGFAIPRYNVAASMEPGETVTVDFIADKPGVYPYYCLEFCSALHLEMTGYLMVKPESANKEGVKSDVN